MVQFLYSSADFQENLQNKLFSEELSLRLHLLHQVGQSSLLSNVEFSKFGQQRKMAYGIIVQEHQQLFSAVFGSHYFVVVH